MERFVTCVRPRGIIAQCPVLHAMCRGTRRGRDSGADGPYFESSKRSAFVIRRWAGASINPCFFTQSFAEQLGISCGGGGGSDTPPPSWTPRTHNDHEQL